MFALFYAWSHSMNYIKFLSIKAVSLVKFHVNPYQVSPSTNIYTYQIVNVNKFTSKISLIFNIQNTL